MTSCPPGFTKNKRRKEGLTVRTWIQRGGETEEEEFQAEENSLIGCQPRRLLLLMQEFRA